MKASRTSAGHGVAILLSAFSAAAGAHTVNTSGGLNVRTGPGTGYAVLRVLANGSGVGVTGTVSGSWTQINSPAAGWVYSAYLAPGGAHSVNTSGGVNVRTGPGLGYAVIRVLANGTAVTAAGNSGSWTRISSPVSGWAWTAYIACRPGTTTSASSNVIATATTDFVWCATGQIWGIWDSPRSGGPHHAIDICNTTLNTPIYAARGGYLATQAYGTGYGNYVRVTHDAGYSTVYAHLNGFWGARRNVARGERIASMGKTGAANGVIHCHWEIWRYGVKIYCPAYNGQNTRAGGAINYGFAGI